VVLEAFEMLLQALRSAFQACNASRFAHPKEGILHNGHGTGPVAGAPLHSLSFMTVAALLAAHVPNIPQPDI